MAQSITIFLVLTSCSLSYCDLMRMNLGGQWSVVSENRETWLSGTVPGGIYSDLMNSGIIPDIFYGTGDKDYRWVGETGWNYSTIFIVDETFLVNPSINLVFEGLDTFSTVYLNNKEVGKSTNMFVPYAFNVKNVLQLGENEIVVKFDSPVRVAASLANDTENTYVVPPECRDEQYNGICHANRIRKMQTSFSWDWGPAFPSIGIWKDVYLESIYVVDIDYVVVTTVRDANNNWGLNISTYFTASSYYSWISLNGIRFIIETDSGDIIRDITSGSVPVIDGHAIYAYYIPFSYTYVTPWWPNGLGTQKLYNVTVSYMSGTNSVTKTVRIGYRAVELVQDRIEQGANFYFKVNGRAVFALGANVIPLNVLPERGQDPEVIRKVLQTARDSNMNMLRVRGGGVYESDYFYDLADEYGIMIWQDFMFARAMYPADADFLSNVAEEVRHQTKRLGSHPSVVLWCGNNENEGALSQNWYGTADHFDLFKQDYIKLYVDTIKPELLSILPPAVYITSSPTNGVESDEEDHVAQNPADLFYGDVHFYDYNGDSWNTSRYPVPRFASEYGFQSMPSLESWMTATDNLTDLLPTSTFMNQRQHHPQGNEQNMNLINLQLQLPEYSSGENYIKAFIYFSQIVQAESVKLQTEYYRSFKRRIDYSQRRGFTMGALYGQLNDVWVAPTWSGMDFTGRWKMLQYAAKDFFSPIIVTGNLKQNNQLEVYAILDQLQAPQNTIVKSVIHIYKWESLEPLTALEYPVTLDPLKAVLVTTLDAPKALKSAGCGSDYAVAKTKCFFHLNLIDQNNNHLAPFNYVFPEKLKNCNLPDANLQIISIEGVDEGGKLYEITLTTDVNTLFVWLDSHEIEGRFSENGFLQVLPTKTVTFMADYPTTLEEMTQTVTVTHLRDRAYR